MKQEDRDFNWVNATVMTVTPIAAALGLYFYISANGVHPGDLITFFVMYWITGISITAGYHRYYAHRSYQCHPVMQFLFLVFGAAALQNSIVNWGSDHRRHHRFVDHDADPYNINKGFFWAHMGWIYFNDTAEIAATRVVPPDYAKDRLVQWQHKYYIPIFIVAGLILPMMAGLIYGRPGGALLWGGLVRLVCAHHATFLINSYAHWFGRRPYSHANTARDSAILALMSFGEGYHNFHHAFPADYRNGIAWHHFDPSKWLIGGLSRVGVTWNLRRTSEAVIERAKARVLLQESGNEVNTDGLDDTVFAPTATAEASL